MGPPLRNFAADAHDCIMVEVHEDQPNTRLWRVDPHPEGEFPLGSHDPMPGLSTGRRRLTRVVDRRRPVDRPRPNARPERNVCNMPRKPNSIERALDKECPIQATRRSDEDSGRH
jgi:hypothetical protein